MTTIQLSNQKKKILSQNHFITSFNIHSIFKFSDFPKNIFKDYFNLILHLE